MSIIKEKLSACWILNLFKSIDIIFIIVGVLLPKFHSFETDLDSLLM